MKSHREYNSFFIQHSEQSARKKEHLCRPKEWPDGFNCSMKYVNSEIYTMMQGPSEFGVAGRLSNWDIRTG
jgi:hypothetical protein